MCFVGNIGVRRHANLGRDNFVLAVIIRVHVRPLGSLSRLSRKGGYPKIRREGGRTGFKVTLEIGVRQEVQSRRRKFRLFYCIRAHRSDHFHFRLK